MAEQTYMKIAGIDGIPTIGGASINAWHPPYGRYETYLFSGGLGNTATFSAAPLSQPASAFDMLAICVCNQGNGQVESNEINYVPAEILNKDDNRNCVTHLRVNLGGGGNEYWYQCYSYYNSADNTIYARVKPNIPGTSTSRFYTELSGNYTNTAIAATTAVHYNNKCIKWVKGVKFYEQL